MANRGPDLLSPRLARALEHPIRTEILGILRDGPSSPARIQRQLDNVSLNLVSHHIKVLKDLGCVALQETVKKKGAKEHIYRATDIPILTAEEWEGLSPKVQRRITLTILRQISDDLAVALGAGKLDADPDSHISHAPLRLDRRGSAEVSAVLERALEEVLAIDAKSRKRSQETGEEPLPSSIAIMYFPTAK